MELEVHHLTIWLILELDHLIALVLELDLGQGLDLHFDLASFVEEGLVLVFGYVAHLQQCDQLVVL